MLIFYFSGYYFFIVLRTGFRIIATSSWAFFALAAPIILTQFVSLTGEGSDAYVDILIGISLLSLSATILLDNLYYLFYENSSASRYRWEVFLSLLCMFFTSFYFFIGSSSRIVFFGVEILGDDLWRMTFWSIAVFGAFVIGSVRYFRTGSERLASSVINMRAV